MRTWSRWLLGSLSGVYLGFLSWAACWFRAEEELFSGSVLFSGLLVYFSALLVWVTWRFHNWSQSRIEIRENPELIIHGKPRIWIERHSGSQEISIWVSFLVGNPGNVVASLTRVEALIPGLSCQDEPEWKWESLYPPLVARRDPWRTSQPHEIIDVLPAPILSGGLTRVYSESKRIPTQEGESISRDHDMEVRLTYSIGNQPEKTTEYKHHFTSL